MMTKTHAYEDAGSRAEPLYNPWNHFPVLYFPALAASPSSPCTLEHFDRPGSSRKHESIALTALEMDASSPFSCQ